MNLLPNKNRTATATLPRSSQPLVAIEVGSKRIKVATGRYQNGVIHLKNLCSCPSPDNAAYDPSQNTMAVSHGLANLLKSNRINLKNTVCTVESAEFVRRDLLVPHVKNNEIKKMLQYELSSQLPIDVSAYAVQHKVMGEVQTENGPQVHVQVCAIPKGFASHYFNTLQGANLKPVAMDTNTNAIEKLFQINRGFPGNTMLIDLGNTGFNVSFFRDGKFQFNKILDVGGQTLDDIIINNAKVHPNEAEQLKISNLSRLSIVELERDYGDPRTIDMDLSMERMILAQTVQSVKTWIRSIDSVIRYYVSRHATGQSIDQILLYGGNAYIRDIDRLFEASLKIKTNRLESLNCVRLDRTVQVQGLTEYLNVIGALIRA